MKKGRKYFLVVTSVILIISILILVGAGAAYLYVKNEIDYSVDEKLFSQNQSGSMTRFYYNASDEYGRYEARELSAITPSGAKKVWYSYSDISEHLKNAFISAEDRGFFTHEGVDLKRTVFAIFNYFFHIKPTFGASTITQQVIKNISGDNQQTAKRKIAEIIRAYHIENTHSKDEIFEVYLNIVPMGEGICGVGLASEYYFGKTPSDLTLSEAAALVGITNAPGRYNPHASYAECISKRNNVLYSMFDNGAISEQEYKDAINTELDVMPKREISSVIDSWFVETVCDDVVRDLVNEKGISEAIARLLVYNGGLSIYTTIDPEIQTILEEYFENDSNLPDEVKAGLEYSMVVSDSLNGDLLAIIGAAGEKRSNRILNYATLPHPPASTLKPLALYAPLINSYRINWASVFDDVPVHFIKSDVGYTEYPKNSPDVYDGLMTVSDAIRLSKNTVAVRLYEILGSEKIYHNLTENFNFNTVVKEYKSKDGRILSDLGVAPLALGQLSIGVSLRALTEAYTVFPSEGKLSKGRSYISVYDDKGDLLLINEPDEKPVFNKECARIMNMLLSGVTESGTAKSVTLNEIVDTAGKTGTSSGNRDKLFVGYTPYYTAGIWCGYSDGTSAVNTLSKSHLKIWDEVMNKVHEKVLSKEETLREFSTEGLLYLPYCSASGELFTNICALDPRGDVINYGYFSPAYYPRKDCQRHVLCKYDFLSGGVANEGCDEEWVREIALLDISDRKFPIEIFITDAEYVWRKVDEGIKLGDSYNIPFFQYTLENFEYCGKSRGRKQFNANCYLHDD